MKKYYLHNGTDLVGPYDIEELKIKSINRDTPVWHKGLSQWTTAEKINELGDVFETTPPPFSRVMDEPPPIQKTNQGTKIPPPPKKTANWSRGIISSLIIVGILLLAFVIVSNNPGSIPGIKVQINTPKPFVITKNANDANSTLLKAKTTVYSTIQNAGGDGNVLVTFHVYQDGLSFERVKSVFLRSNEIQNLEVTFDEVRRLGGRITYNVETRAE